MPLVYGKLEKRLAMPLETYRDVECELLPDVKREKMVDKTNLLVQLEL